MLLLALITKYPWKYRGVGIARTMWVFPGQLFPPEMSGKFQPPVFEIREKFPYFTQKIKHSLIWTYRCKSGVVILKQMLKNSPFKMPICISECDFGESFNSSNLPSGSVARRHERKSSSFCLCKADLKHFLAFVIIKSTIIAVTKDETSSLIFNRCWP